MVAGKRPARLAGPVKSYEMLCDFLRSDEGFCFEDPLLCSFIQSCDELLCTLNWAPLWADLLEFIQFVSGNCWARQPSLGVPLSLGPIPLMSGAASKAGRTEVETAFLV
jgi:hypothetical protein